MGRIVHGHVVGKKPARVVVPNDWDGMIAGTERYDGNEVPGVVPEGYLKTDMVGIDVGKKLD